MKYCKRVFLISILIYLAVANSNAQKISKIDSLRFIHKPSKAMKLSAILPGAGQVYNKKYWKLPFVYGLLGGLGYAVYYNNDKYQFYKEALANANSAGPYNYYFTGQLSQIPLSQRKNILEINKDNYRRTRDLDVIFLFISYIANIVDAGVDAYFMTYDIGSELAFSVHPHVLELNYNDLNHSPTLLTNNILGVSLKLKFK